MQDGDSVIQRAGYLDSNYIWYQVHGSIIVPLAADFTTANIPDNQMYSILLTASLPITIIKRTLFMSADPGYDDHELYDLSTDMGFQLVCPCTKI